MTDVTPSFMSVGRRSSVRTVFSIVAVALVLTAARPALARVPESQSAAPAAALVKLMQEKGLDAFAVPDPKEPGRFIAVLSFPGTQLLVVSAKIPVPSFIQDMLAKRQYRDAYMELQGPTAKDGRFFVQDMQADGLLAKPGRGESFDIVYENGVSTSFDGDWQAHGVSEADYDAKFVAADQRYADALTTLAAGLNALK